MFSQLLGIITGPVIIAAVLGSISFTVITFIRSFATLKEFDTFRGEAGYMKLGKTIYLHGVTKDDRTGTGTLGIFGPHLVFDLSDGTFPLLTTKKVPFKSMTGELLWFLGGKCNLDDLHTERYGNCKIWDSDYRRFKQAKNQTDDGNMGPIYGVQWRNWGGKGIDQINNVIHSLRENPNSRRHIVSAWNVEELNQMCLPPCHYMMQFYVADNKLSCLVNIRSSDYCLGLPYNIASYALLIHLIAHQLSLQTGELRLQLGDSHMYKDHISTWLREQSVRRPGTFPKIKINSHRDEIADYLIEDFELVGYDPQPTIKYNLSTGEKK